MKTLALASGLIGIGKREKTVLLSHNLEPFLDKSDTIVQRMKALQLNEDQSLELVELPMPKAGKGEVVVKVMASALNHREIWIQKGLYPGMTLPCVLGADGAGVVSEIGEGVDSSFLDNEVIIYPAYDWGEREEAPSRQFRVLGMPDPGTMAEYIKIPAQNMIAKPEYLSWEEAAAIPVAGLTAWRALVRNGGIAQGKKVLITGIGGGVAQAGLGLAKAFDAKVFVTSSSEKKIEQSISLGAKGGVNYKSEDWNLQLKALSGGIDIVLDSSPSANLDDYFKFMNYGGRIVSYGSTGAPKTTISISKFFLRHIQFIGTAMGSQKEFSDVVSFMDQHKIKPLIYRSFSLDDAVASIEELKKGQQVGKIVLSH